ncbi:MAG: PEP-CTERM sorting domain-containing protein [Proteobacteria bacterium]|nr:PEP-CTERM sorting domain-containing protein [Pseudomonadota bacterium]
MRGCLAVIAVAATALAAMGPATSALAANPSAYETTGGEGFGTVDLATGVYTAIGQTTLGGAPIQLSGLGVYGGQLYGEEYRGSTLYRVDPATGALTAVSQHVASGALPTFLDTGSTLGGLFGFSSTGELYGVDPLTGLVTDIGATGISVTGTVGMSTNSAALYINENDRLFSLNTATGAATLIGQEHPAGALFGAMVTVDGQLYGADVSPRSFYSIDPATAQVTFLANASGAPGGVYGLAPTVLGQAAAGAPEPAAWSLMIAGLGGAGGLLRRRRARRLAAETS